MFLWIVTFAAEMCLVIVVVMSQWEMLGNQCFGLNSYFVTDLNFGLEERVSVSSEAFLVMTLRMVFGDFTLLLERLVVMASEFLNPFSKRSSI